MRAFGSRRTTGKCRVYRAGWGKKILFTVRVKNRKADRQAKVEQ